MKLSRLAYLGLSLGTFGLLSTWSQSVAATEDYFGNKGIQFQKDTIVEFEFIESHGAYQSTFGVIDLDSCQADAAGVVLFESCAKTPLLKEVKPSDTNETVYRRSTYETNTGEKDQEDFLGTPGNAVIEPKAEFLFKAEKKYAFYLESQFNGKSAGIVYSTDLLNSQGNKQALFDREDLSTVEVAQRRNTANENQFPALIDGGVFIHLDDTGSTLVQKNNEDIDFDDFVVGVGGGYDCLSVQPESN
jgi:hypothetical protein